MEEAVTLPPDFPHAIHHLLANPAPEFGLLDLAHQYVAWNATAAVEMIKLVACL